MYILVSIVKVKGGGKKRNLLFGWEVKNIGGRWRIWFRYVEFGVFVGYLGMDV